MSLRQWGTDCWFWGLLYPPPLATFSPFKSLVSPKSAILAVLISFSDLSPFLSHSNFPTFECDGCEHFFKKKVSLICGDDGDAQKANQMHETCADADHEISRCQLLGALCLIECDWEPAHVVNMKTSQVSAGPPPQKPIRRPLSSAIKLNAAVSNVFIYQPASFFLGGRRRRRLICSWKSWHGRPLYPYKNI